MVSCVFIILQVILYKVILKTYSQLKEALWLQFSLCWGQAAKHAPAQAVLDYTSIMENGFFDIVNCTLNITASVLQAL